ncbi:FCD domain-containing protein [Saccharopolyspora sp. NPDC000995]
MEQNERAYFAGLPRTFAEHRAILQAITAGDAEAARWSSREHLNRVISQQESLVTAGEEP